jgi:mRNA-degrading endonuclease RelE of RelBE toxin-antitoxin system
MKYRVDFSKQAVKFLKKNPSLLEIVILSVETIDFRGNAYE